MKADFIVYEDLRNVLERISDCAGILAGRTLVIAGGAGFLGSYLTAVLHLLNREVLREPCTVFVLDNYIVGREQNRIIGIEDGHISFVTQDVRDPLEVAGDVHYVIHAAGIASPIYYRKFPVEAIESAVWGAKNLLELARAKNVGGFLFFSSSEIYGDPAPEYIPTPETYWGNVSCNGPRACYDESKRLAETLCMTYRQRWGVPVKIVRPFNVYGPGMRPDDGRVIPTFLVQALSGEPLRVHGTGTQSRAFCYVSDAVAGFFKVLLCGKSGEVYNVGNDREEISMLALARLVTELFPNRPVIQLVEYPDAYPRDEIRRRVPDLTKIRTQLGYEPLVDLASGLRRTLGWLEKREIRSGS
jgi:UDP-glucuronate decarboxylase